jgi:hypothetical protein
MKKHLVLVAVVVALMLGGCATDMFDCCECLMEANEITCIEPQAECVDQCFDSCEFVDACRCSAASRAGCSEVCGCTLGL